MSDSFDDRERAFESKWAHDEELRFRVVTRRNRLLAAWAASEMGLDPQATADYVAAILDLEITSGKDDVLAQKIRDDFDARQIPRTDHLIQRRMTELLAVAKEAVMTETKA